MRACGIVALNKWHAHIEKSGNLLVLAKNKKKGFVNFTPTALIRFEMQSNDDALI